MIESHSALLALLKTNPRIFPDDIERHLPIFRFAFSLRRIQETLIADYAALSEIRCPVHFCLGQELTYGVVAKCIEHDDLLFAHHRSHGSYFAKKGDLREFFLELLGKTGGACNGYAGSQDIASPANNMYAGAIVTGSVGLAVGGAFAISRRQGSHCISAAVFGEGATNQGLFYECLNYASLRELPILFICENNSFATYSTMDQHTAGASLKPRVTAFGVRYESTSTFLPALAIRAIAAAFDHVRKKRKPSFLEIFTYRYNPHVGPQDDTGVGYRTKDDIQIWRNFDPLDRFMQDFHDTEWMPGFKELLSDDTIKIRSEYEAARIAQSATSIQDATMSDSFTQESTGIPRVSFSNTVLPQDLTVPGPY